MKRRLVTYALFFLGLAILGGTVGNLLSLATKQRHVDDSNTANQIPKSNAHMLPDLQSFLGNESAVRDQEARFANFVDIGFFNQSTATYANPNACFQTSAVGLTMILGTCRAYNAGFRSTCGVGNNLGLGPGGTVPNSATADCPGGNSITFPDNSTTWVAMDENTVGNNAGLTNFTRVVGTHYLIDTLDALTPSMPFDAQLLMRVITSGGSIISVSDLRNFSPFTPPLNGADVFVHSITGIGFEPFIIGMNWNKVVDVRAFGCHGDLKVDHGEVVTTNGSATITSTANPWTSADVGKSIRIEESLGTFSFYTNTFVGTIVKFNNAGSIDLNVVYPGAGSATSNAEWGTPDDACMTAMNTYFGTETDALNAAMVIDTVPIIFTQPIVFDHATGWFKCNGGGSANQTGFIWMGTTPDQVGITVKQSLTFKLEGCQVVGATTVPLLWGIKLLWPVGATTVNASNIIQDDIVGSGFGGTAEAVVDRGIGINTTTLAANAVKNDGALTLTATPVGLRPGAPIKILDIANGSETAWVALTYTPGSTTVPLINSTNAPSITHPAGDTVFWADAPVTIGMGTDWTGTQNDRQTFSNDIVRDAGVGMLFGLPLNAAIEVLKPDINNAMIGIVSAGAKVGVYDGEQQGVCNRWLIAQQGSITSNGSSNEQLGADDRCGPQDDGNFTGLDIPIEFASTGLFVKNTSAGGTFFMSAGQISYGKNSPTDGADVDIIDSGMAVNPVNVFLDHTSIITNQASGALPPAKANPVLHSREVGITTRNYKMSFYINQRGAHLKVVDDGFADNRVSREYDLTVLNQFFTGNTVPNHIAITLIGSETWQDALANYIATDGFSSLLGATRIKTLGAATTPFSGNCTGTEGDGTKDYYYQVAYGVYDYDANAYKMGKASNATGPGAAAIGCNSTVDAAHPVHITTFPKKGASVACFYRAECATGCGSNPGGEALAGCLYPNTNGTVSGAEPIWTFLDTNSTPSGTPPAIDSTGSLTVEGEQQYPVPKVTAIASLPTCNAAALGLTGWWVDDATVPCVWAATPVATSSPSVRYPVRCWNDSGSTFNWRCSN